MLHRQCSSLQILSAFLLICTKVDLGLGFAHYKYHNRQSTSCSTVQNQRTSSPTKKRQLNDRSKSHTSLNVQGEQAGDDQQEPSQLYANYGGNFFDEILSYGNDDEDDEYELPPNLEDEFEDYVPKINSVTLVGRVGQDPEPRYFNDNKVVLRLSLAVKRKYHPLERQARNIQSGEEETDWFNLELWGRDAEYAGKFVTKGARIGVTGSLNVDTWTDKVTGEERWSNKILVKHLDILESRAEAELRMSNQGNYRGSQQGQFGNYNSNNNNYGQEGGNDYDSGPSSAGSGGFFDS